MPKSNGGTLTLVEVADRTGRNIVDLRRWAREGRIPAFKLGRDWLLRAVDLPMVEALPQRRRRAGGRGPG